MCTFLTAWGDALLYSLGGSPGLLFVLYSLALFLDIYLGLACRPADFVLPICLWSPFRGTPILAGGIGVARFLFSGFVLFVLVRCLGNINVSVFACHATGLDAVQRLEQKK